MNLLFNAATNKVPTEGLSNNNKKIQHATLFYDYKQKTAY